MSPLTFQSVYQTETSPNFKIGTRGQTPDGRQWVYVKATDALAKGKVAIQGAIVAVDTVTSSTDALGRIVYITKAAAGWTAGAYEDDLVVVDDGTGKGQSAKIKTNTADTLELYPENALTTALSVVDSDITIVRPNHVLIAAVTSKVQGAIGIAQCAFAANDYGWLLTNGDGVVFTGSTLVVGAGFSTGDDTTGQVIVAVTATGPYDFQNLGIAWVANSAADMLALVRVDIR
jgi:hypothetical protein